MSQGEEGTDSPTINVFTVFLALAISAKRKMHKVVYDVAGAYLNADLKTPEYMRLSKEVSKVALTHPAYPPCLRADGTITVKLKKALYGLKQASRAWFDLLVVTLKNMGFKQGRMDRCCFFRNSNSKWDICWCMWMTYLFSVM